MKVIRNNIIPFSGYKAINLFGILFCRKNAKMDFVILNHENIHTAQMKEMLYIPFYIWYAVEWTIRLMFYWNFHWAYRNISFEKEAYIHEGNIDYLKDRRLFSWIYYIF